MMINKTAASNTIMVISNVNSSSCAFFIRICRLASQLHSRNRSACKSFSYVSNPWELSKTDAISYLWRFKIPFISIQAVVVVAASSSSPPVVVAASSATHTFLDEPPNRRYLEPHFVVQTFDDFVSTSERPIVGTSCRRLVECFSLVKGLQKIVATCDAMCWFLWVASIILQGLCPTPQERRRPNEDFRNPKNISDRRFEHFFKGVSARFGLVLLEKVLKATVRNVFRFSKLFVCGQSPKSPIPGEFSEQ